MFALDFVVFLVKAIYSDFFNFEVLFMCKMFSKFDMFSIHSLTGSENVLMLCLTAHSLVSKLILANYETMS